MFYSLRTRLTFTFIVLLVIPLITMVIILTRVSNNEIGNSIEESASQTIDQYAIFVNTLNNQVEDVANQVLSNEVTQHWLSAQMDPELKEETRVLMDAELRKFLSSIALNHTYISSITLFNDQGRAVGISDLSFRDPSFLKAAWYQNFRNGGERWMSAHEDPYQPGYLRKESVNSLLFNSVHLSTFRNIGVLKVNVLTEAIEEPMQKIKFGETGRVYLLDSQGLPVLRHDVPEFLAGQGSAWEQIISDKYNDGKMIVKHEGENQLVLYRKLKSSDWVVVGEVPEAQLFKRMTSIQLTMLGVAGLLLMLTIAAALWLSRDIARPLSKLVQSMRLAERGEFAQAEAEIIANRPKKLSEVGYAGKVFHQMLTRLRFLIETEFQANIRRKDAEYKALLMQINPHFLYNTLEAIGSLAAQGHSEKVADVTESLGQMLRYSLRTDSDLVRSSEEVRYIWHYIEILRVRFGSRLDIEIEEEQGLGNVMIVKFILQPLVENAVKFSLENADTAIVRVSVRSIENNIEICISDNGMGMPAELVEELYRDFSRGQMSEVLGASGRRIGLRNVLARCYLNYGERMRLTIDSKLGCGTSITLSIPRNEG